MAKTIELLKEESKVEAIGNKCEQLEKDNAQTLIDLAKTRSELSAFKLKYEERCKVLSNERSIMEEKVRDISQKYEKLCATVLERKKVFEEAKSIIEEKSKRVEELSVIVETLNESMEQKNCELVLKEKNIEELVDIVNQIKSCFSSAQIEGDNSITSIVKEMMEKQRETVNCLEVEVEGLRGTLSSKSQIFVDYQYKIDEITEILEVRSKRIDELDIELQFLKKEKSNLENEIIELKKLMEEKEVKLKELAVSLKKLALEKLSSETCLNDEIESLSNENLLMKEKIDKMNEALSKKVNKIDDAYNYIEVLNSESENLCSLNKAMEDKYLKVLFEKKQFNEQKDKYERIIEALKSQNEKLLDELNNQQMILLKMEKSNKNAFEKESKNQTK
ncbi:predicted protein [Naegleria gruberi]|uniref:Predicted protein n=1 Tax=Naegleria gruberi TaxID=5762 RepID=D2V0H4_NAEGR|nr:uncharacterized protein NAEGRDRAFT_45700 [Naegleria gruberi]EFC49524.1 predicted protein [Naegleria gruberi]|eukprot:XP_002682268.1 predicted protein [Naegleria gruberi strain NEG-M]